MSFQILFGISWLGLAWRRRYNFPPACLLSLSVHTFFLLIRDFYVWLLHEGVFKCFFPAVNTYASFITVSCHEISQQRRQSPILWHLREIIARPWLQTPISMHCLVSNIPNIPENSRKVFTDTKTLQKTVPLFSILKFSNSYFAVSRRISRGFPLPISCVINEKVLHAGSSASPCSRSLVISMG